MSIYWLLIAMPVAAGLEILGAAAPLIFFVAAVAIVPLAALIVHSTEHLAAHTGAALGGLLTATFGNLPELIIAMVALRAGLVDMVRASLVGALLAVPILSAIQVMFMYFYRKRWKESPKGGTGPMPRPPDPPGPIGPLAPTPILLQTEDSIFARPDGANVQIVGNVWSYNGLPGQAQGTIESQQPNGAAGL